jgi:hypothetical protein
MAIAHTSVYDEFAEFITSSPTLEEITQFRLSEPTEERINALLDANRNRALTADEQAELDEAIRVEHLMRLVKIRAYARLDGKS